MIIIATIWLIGSLIAIYIADRKYLWEPLLKILTISTILALIYNGYTVYNPNANNLIGGVIEVNETWNLALFIAIIEGIMITGPIALIYDIHMYYKIKRKA